MNKAVLFKILFSFVNLVKLKRVSVMDWLVDWIGILEFKLVESVIKTKFVAAVCAAVVVAVVVVVVVVVLVLLAVVDLFVVFLISEFP